MMSTVIEVTMPGNLRVEAKVGDFVVATDQPEKSGGDNSAPPPFTLFTCSLATCAGYFALQFCNARKLSTEGMKLTMEYDWDKEQKRYPKMTLRLHLPEGFPEKYRSAILRAMDQCAVKKHVMDPPEFDIDLVG